MQTLTASFTKPVISLKRRIARRWRRLRSPLASNGLSPAGRCCASIGSSKTARSIEQIGTKNGAEKSGHGTENRDDSTGRLKMTPLQSPASVVITRQGGDRQEYPEQHECHANNQRHAALL